MTILDSGSFLGSHCIVYQTILEYVIEVGRHRWFDNYVKQEC